MSSLAVYRVQLIREPADLVREEADTPSDAAQILRQYLEFEDREHFVTLLLGARNALLGIHTVSIGTPEQVLVSPREVFKAAILSNATSIILAHNHPSGDPTPSEEDQRITHQLHFAGDLLGIPVLDHIVIGSGGRYFSMAEQSRNPFRVGSVTPDRSPG